MGTALKSVADRLQEQIKAIKTNAEEAKSALDFESMFLFLDRVNELENQLEKEGGAIY